MRIRTVTYFIDEDIRHIESGIEHAALRLSEAKEALSAYETQTLRAACRPEIMYKEGGNIFRHIDSVCADNDVHFFSCGYTSEPELIKRIPEYIGNTERLFMSSACVSGASIDEDALNASAHAIMGLSEIENGNLRFCAGASIKPDTPFFPASFTGRKGFTLGLEAGDVLFGAFRDGNTEHEKMSLFIERFSEETANIRQLLKGNSEFLGIDTSMAPGFDKESSVAYAYNAYLGKPFGAQGTKELTRDINAVLKSFDGHVGYSGLMFPVMEDVGLAEYSEHYCIEDLIDYSTVCGCGLDTVPVPGSAGHEQIAYLIRRIAENAIQYRKPLSARIMPAKGKRAGEIAVSTSPYLVDCRVFEISVLS